MSAWERHGPRGYVAMRVTARMDEPIAYLGDLLHLDGPLAYAAYHDLDARTRSTIPDIQVTEWPIDLTLPLSTWWCNAQVPGHDVRLEKRWRTGSGGPPPMLWGWCASAADETAWLGRGAIEVRKKPALDEMRRYTPDKTTNVSSGHMKAYDLAFPTVLACEVVWYAHGDPERVQHLLDAHVPAIGKKRNCGNGTVRQWTVETCAEDWSIVGEGGRLMRRLPLGAVDGQPGHGAIRPPYYHATRIVASVEPTW